MSLLNQVCKQVTRRINKDQSSLTPTGVSLPPDLIEHIVWTYLLPEYWVVPRSLQQDICLLRASPPMEYDCLYSMPMPPSVAIEKGGGGEWWTGQLGSALMRDPRFLAKALTKSHHVFQTNWSSEGAESIFGKDHEQILKTYVKQSNWPKVKILNYMRSVECPVLCVHNSPDDLDPCHDIGSCETLSHMEMRELTEEDVIKGGGSFEDTKQRNQLLLEETLDAIISNDQQMLGRGHLWQELGTSDVGPNGLIWHPMINGRGNITFTSR